jgi:hypothetical protein
MRYDRGMRPRTAITLWQSLVRPILEFASEIWSGQIPRHLEQKAEAIQLKFLRGTLGLHKNGSGVANEVLRAEAGCERLSDRWTKLRLGYWRRVFAAPRGRLLRDLIDFRKREWDASGGKGWGSKGWVGTVKASLDLHGLGECWTNPDRAVVMGAHEWKARVYDAVNARSDADRVVSLAGKPSASTYTSIKEWGPNPENYSFSAGEVGRLGHHVPERYLDDRLNLKGTRLKMLCRLGCLPLMDRVGREAKPPWPRELRTCATCCTGKYEDVHHFMMDCPKYAAKRAVLLKQVVVELVKSNGNLKALQFATMAPVDQLPVLLGKRFSDPTAEDKIDRTVKRFLSKCWNLRSEVTGAINDTLFTSYGIYSAPVA